MAENTTKPSIKYWEGVNADVDGMLGGIPQIPEYAHIDKVDIQSSKNLLAKLGFGARKGLRLAQNALEGGAGYVNQSITSYLAGCPHASRPLSSRKKSRLNDCFPF